MSVLELGHIDHIKRNNTGKVYQLIDRHGPISRIDLSKMSQLAPASITKITRELLQSQLVVECDTGDFAGRGRPAVALVTHHSSWQFLSVKVTHDGFTLGLHELSGHVLIAETTALKLDLSQNSAQALLSVIHRFFAAHQTYLQRIMALVLIFPGEIRLGSDAVLPISQSQLASSPLVNLLENETGLTVIVSHQIRAQALGERWFSDVPLAGNALVLSVEEEINMALWLNDAVTETESSRLGQLSHWTMDTFGLRCHCGHHGCLETLVGTKYVLNQVRNRLADGRPSLLSARSNLTIKSLCEAAMAGDALAKSCVMEIGQVLGKALAPFVTAFDPEEIRISSAYNAAQEIWFPVLLSSLQQHAFLSHAENLTLRPCLLPRYSLLPAAGLVKQALYDGQLLIHLLNG